MNRLWTAHPLLFAAFPVLFLYAQNADKMRSAETVGPLLFSMGGAAALTLLLALIIRRLRKAALLSTLIITLFFSFGHLVEALPDFSISPFGLMYDTMDVVAVLWVALFGLFATLILKSKSNLKKITVVMGQLGLLLVIVQLAQSGIALASQETMRPPTQVTIDRTDLPEKLPDIYFIIMDAFGREDVLRDKYNVDISEFIAFLRERGFFVADRGHSNYHKTIFSLPATLNLNYLETLIDLDPDAKDKMMMAEYLRDNKVFSLVKDLGYTTVSFANTGSSYTEAVNTDISLETSGGMSEFQQILISTTILPLFISDETLSENPRRQMVLAGLAKLTDLGEVPSPKFVFAHILSPHSPYVFGPDGEHISNREIMASTNPEHDKTRRRREMCLKGYAGQVTYICKRLQGIITEMLEATPDNPPIIILQGDHGPRCGNIWYSYEKTDLKECLSILNAIYLPGVISEKFYDEISSVNTFRLVFNEYFNTNFALLPDRSFYSTDDRPFAFKEVSPERLAHHRGPYDDLLGQDFDSLTTLDRMHLYQLGLTDRKIEDCYAEEKPLMTFNGGQLEIADCRLTLQASLRYSFEAIFIKRDLPDKKYTIQLKFHPRSEKNTANRRKPFSHSTNLAVSNMPENQPTYVVQTIELPFVPEGFELSIFIPGKRPPEYLILDGGEKIIDKIISGDDCCP